MSYTITKSMAKRRGRRPGTLSIDGLMAELASLDVRRKQIQASIQAAVSSVISGIPSPFSSGRKRGRPAGSKNVATKATRKRRKMSKEARAKIAAAQRARWAKQKGTAK